MISVSGLSKTFGTTVALSDVSFEIGAGEIAGLLGRNGAGKTTTLRLLTGYFPPTAGDVRVAGHDMASDPLAAKARLGYLPEVPPAYREMIVGPYLRFCGRLRGVPADLLEARLAHVIERCGIGSVRGRIIGHLSRGYQQRVGLAQAFVHDPDVLVLDEPTANLDPGQIHEMRTFIRELSQEERPVRRTIILSTHRLDDVAATCQRAIVISRGRLVADERLGSSTVAADLERRFLELTQGEESR